MRTRRIALLVAVAGLAILMFGLLTPTTMGGADGGMNGGTDTERTVYTIDNAAFILIGAFVLGAGLSFYIFKEDYVPVSIPVPTSVSNTTDAQPQIAPPHPETQVDQEKEAAPISGDDMLVLRLLNGDERQMYRTIVDLGGSALQKDLIVRTKMSDAKVSRVIDRLIEKGLVTKERHGVTNRISISIEK
jgi:hypothetical protein